MPMRSWGLRARVTAGFAGGALVLSIVTAVVPYQLTRSSLVEERERTAIRIAYFDAVAVRSDLAGERPDVVEVLRTLDTGESRGAVLRRDGRWYARDADAGLTAAVPEALQRMVEQGQPGVQRVGRKVSRRSSSVCRSAPRPPSTRSRPWLSSTVPLPCSRWSSPLSRS